MMAGRCQKEAEAMQKAYQTWQEAKSNTQEKLEARTHRAILLYGGGVIAGGVIALAFVSAAGAIIAAETPAAATGAFTTSVGVDAASVVTSVSNRFGLTEADHAYWHAVDQEGVAFGNYLTAKRHYNHCLKAHGR